MLAIVALLLYCAACLGHAIVLIYSMNVLYGLRVPKWVMRSSRISYAFLLAAFPIAMLQVWNPLSWPRFPSESVPWPFVGYLILCWFLAVIVFPLQTLRRILRPSLPLRLANDTETIDIARVLGFQPHGHGKRRWLARLPFNQIYEVDFTAKSIVLPRLPAAWDGLTILHVSDLHLRGTPDLPFFERVLELCKREPADIVVLTGDIIDGEQYLDWVAPSLGGLQGRIATFAVLGNHDQWFDVPRIRDGLKRLNYDVLANGWRQLEIRGETLVVIGNERPWLGSEPDLRDCPSDGFRLCVSHTPDNLPWAKRHRVDLMLAGHNHGGQIRLPIIGPVHVPSIYSRRYDCDLFYEPPTLMHVVRGLSGSHPIRLNCRPEVAKLVVRQP